MKADDVDLAGRDAMPAQKRLDRLGMRVGDDALRRRRAGPAAPPGPSGRAASASAPRRSLALGVGVGAVPGRPERHDPLAVGLDQRDVDAVERRAAHQPDRPASGSCLANPGEIAARSCYTAGHQHKARPGSDAMSTPQSDFLRVLTERGFMHQCSDPEGLDERAKAGGLTAYIGFDCTAPSLHVGSLVQIMMLHWLQQTGQQADRADGRRHDPGRRPVRARTRAASSSPSSRSKRTSAGIRHGLLALPEFGDGPDDAIMADNADWLTQAQLHRVPARRRPALLGQPHAVVRLR